MNSTAVTDQADTLGARIRMARKHRDLTVEELSQSMGVEQASVVAWEEDDRPPRANRLNILCGMLDVSLPWLLNGGDAGAPGVRDATLGELQSDLERVSQQLFALAGTVDAMRERVSAANNPD